jgi:hypothetical protein
VLVLTTTIESIPSVPDPAALGSGTSALEALSTSPGASIAGLFVQGPATEEYDMSRLIGIIVVVWLLIGVFAAYQRGYFTDKRDVSCKKGSDTVLTVVAGPLNYAGVNPKVKCRVPQPSK